MKVNKKLKDEYVLLCIDPSYKCTGWSILQVSNKGNLNLDDKNVQLIDYGIIPTNLSDVGKSLMYIEKVIVDVVKKYKPDYVVSEQMFGGSNRQTAMRLANVHGVLQLICAKNFLDIVYFSVMTAKSVVSGGIKTKKADGTKKTGDEMKQEIADIVINILGKSSFKNEYTLDVTDAISMGITFIKLNGEPPSKKKTVKKRKTTKSEKSISK